MWGFGDLRLSKGEKSFVFIEVFREEDRRIN